jgi:plastocyanin
MARSELRHSSAVFRLEELGMRSLILSLTVFSLVGGTHPDRRGASAPDANVPTATTGQTLTVKMLFDAKGMRFEPKNIAINRGDVIRFVNVSGGPHNVAFDPSKIPAAGRAPLRAAMTGQTGQLTGPLVTAPNAAYTISFANVPAGTYPYFCTPHLGLGMTGVITIK